MAAARVGAKALSAAVEAIDRHGILLLYPVANRPDPPSLWGALHPGAEMRWTWDENGDDRVVALWHLRAALAEDRRVVYSKWFRGRATFFSRPVFRALLGAVRAKGPPERGLSREARAVLDLLEESSPQSTRHLRRGSGLEGKMLERAFARALDELWSRLLAVGAGEVDDGAFPSLAVGATRLLYEDLWADAARPALRSRADDAARLERALAASRPLRRAFDAKLAALDASLLSPRTACGILPRPWHPPGKRRSAAGREADAPPAGRARRPAASLSHFVTDAAGLSLAAVRPRPGRGRPAEGIRLRARLRGGRVFTDGPELWHESGLEMGTSPAPACRTGAACSAPLCPSRDDATPRPMNRTSVILNVNDDGATRYLLSKILKKGGYAVAEAASGHEALAAVAKTRPDLVLLDVKLPDISGLEVCRRLKADPATKTLLVVQTSATFASSDRRAQGLDSGADAYLAQPVDAVELLATVRALLRTQQAEAFERRALERVQRMFDAIQEPLFVVGVDGSIEDCNGASRTLLEAPGVPSGLRGRGCSEALREVVPPDALEALLLRARSGRHEIEVSHDARHFRVSGDPLADADGNFEGVVLILTDVSDRKRLEQELRARADQLTEAARRKDEFLGMLAHELRNPLNAIGAATAVWGRTGVRDASTERLHGIINRQTHNLARLVDDLLETARIDRGHLQLRRHPVDLVRAVRRAVQGSQTVFEGRQQRATLRAPGRPLVVDGDELRLEQVLMNLLTNASKFSAPGDTIEVEVDERREGDRRVGEVRVRDHGVGIPREMLGKIFEPFVQVEPSLARSLGGLGIGLSMVKTLVELHGGAAFARSGGVGEGSEFVVQLPLAEGDAAREGPPPTPRRRSAAASEPKRVLVIEDNEDALELVQAWLAQLGHSVRGASDGAAGLELALDYKPEVAFVDIGLPGIDGYEIARRLRAADGGSAVHLVAVTGYGQPEDRARAIEAGFDDHVVKPLSEASLRAALEADHVRRAPD